MTLYCKYHALEPAAWRCPPCHVDFCDTCSPDLPGEATSAVHYCPLCNGELKALGAAHSAPAFWQRLTDFLRYPFSPAALVLLVLAFLLPLMVPDGVVAHVARLGFLLLVVKYAWTALEQVSTGDVQPLGFERLLAAKNNELALGAGMLLVAMVAASGYVFTKSAFYGSLLAVVLLCVVPLVLLAAAVNRSLGSALNAEGIKAALAGIGPLHVVVCLLLVGLLAALQSFVSLFADILPLAAARALGMVAYSYFTIVLFVLCGYLLFQYQESLGFTPAGGSAKRKTHRRADDGAVQVEMFLKEGNYGKAIALLKRDTNKKNASLTAHERYHKLVWAMNDEQSLLEHAPVYFKVLLEAGRDQQVASLLRAYIERIPGYKPEDPDTALALAEAFERMGEYKLAVHVLNGLHKDAPHYARLPEAYLLAARILAEHLSLPQKGLALVQFLEGRFKTHKSYPDIQRALSALAAQMRPRTL
ncbi:MAG: hypothetical protein Q8J78_13520 [Moraxellaceae bacterium]|nr:hypothetical protein [Moraxellaceae bacterium]